MESGNSKLVLLCIFVGFLHGGVAVTMPSDVVVLKELKESVDPRSILAASCLSTWDFRFDPCESAFGEHFTCGLRCNDGNRVTEITLDGAGYNGSLPESLGKLSSLQILDLSNNAFRGTIPQSVGNLTALQRLVLSRNAFSGSIPASVGLLYALQHLSLDNNLLVGSIPPGLNGLQSLVNLELQANKFSGVFPSLSGMRSLNYLDASNNRLSGSLMALPPNLVELGLRNNRLSGSLALNLEEMRFLQVVDLSHNDLSGDLQSGFFNHPNLEQLTLSNNRFTSLQVPGNYGTNSGLIAVDLSYNQLQGPLPPFMATIPRLSSLSLQYNYFTGIIPFQYAMKATSVSAGKEPLVRLFLAGNYLFGLIPAPFMSLSPDNVKMSFVDNCLLDCPSSLFFCQGGQQKADSTCRSFTPLIP